MPRYIRGNIAPPPGGHPDEEIRPVPWPYGKEKIPNGPPVVEIKFDEGIAWDGPGSRDMPPIPKPMQKTVNVPLVPGGPEIKTVDFQTNIATITQLLASAIIQPRSFVTGNMTCAVANRGYQLPDVVIPPTLSIVIKAWFTNVGQIYIAHRQSDSQSVAVAWPLIPNEGIAYRIPNANGVWIMATVAGEGGSYTVEQS